MAQNRILYIQRGSSITLHNTKFKSQGASVGRYRFEGLKKCLTRSQKNILGRNGSKGAAVISSQEELLCYIRDDEISELKQQYEQAMLFSISVFQLVRPRVSNSSSPVGWVNGTGLICRLNWAHRPTVHVRYSMSQSGHCMHFRMPSPAPHYMQHLAHDHAAHSTQDHTTHGTPAPVSGAGAICTVLAEPPLLQLCHLCWLFLDCSVCSGTALPTTEPQHACQPLQDLC